MICASTVKCPVRFPPMPRCIATAVLLCTALACTQQPAGMIEWPYIGSEQAHAKFSEADKITAATVGELGIVSNVGESDDLPCALGATVCRHRDSFRVRGSAGGVREIPLAKQLLTSNRRSDSSLGNANCACLSPDVPTVSARSAQQRVRTSV